jgi:hypothetical protein
LLRVQRRRVRRELKLFKHFVELKAAEEGARADEERDDSSNENKVESANKQAASQTDEDQQAGSRSRKQKASA